MPSESKISRPWDMFDGELWHGVHSCPGEINPSRLAGVAEPAAPRKCGPLGPSCNSYRAVFINILRSSKPPQSHNLGHARRGPPMNSLWRKRRIESLKRPAVWEVRIGFKASRTGEKNQLEKIVRGRSNELM